MSKLARRLPDESGLRVAADGAPTGIGSNAGFGARAPPVFQERTPMTAPSPLRRRLLAASSLMLLGTPRARAQATPGVLRVTAIPDEAPTELARKAAPLMTYLGEKLGVKAEFTPVTDYAGAVEALVSKKLDLAWF